MRSVGVRYAVRLAVVLAFLAAAGLPALADSASVQLTDGSVLKVWEQRGRALPGRALPPWSINYSVTDAAGTRLGIVSPTADTARDSAPFLTLDETGSAVLVWSRFDGSYRKIAFSRYMGGTWTDFHYLTFGPGNDDQPRVGAGIAFAYLFFNSGPGVYQYAPLDLLTGRLFAAPHALDFGSARRDILEPPGAAVRATVDIPIVNRCNGERDGCSSKSGSPKSPSSPTMQGGTVDIPIVNNKASVWGVGSDTDCAHMILVVPDHALKTAFVFHFVNGISLVLDRVSLPPQIENRWGEGIAASYLPSICY